MILLTAPSSLLNDNLQEEPDVTTFLRMVGDKILHKWRALGLYLGVPQSKIEQTAQAKEQTDTTFCSCVVEIFEYWKSHLPVDKKPTWNELIMAVRNVDETLFISMKRKLMSSLVASP